MSGTLFPNTLLQNERSQEVSWSNQKAVIFTLSPLDMNDPKLRRQEEVLRELGLFMLGNVAYSTVTSL